MHRSIDISFGIIAFLAIVATGAATALSQDAAEGPMVFGVHDFEIAEDIEPSELEKFVKEKFAPAWKEPRAGMQLFILKGDRGDRKDKYRLVFAFDSVVTRDKHFPRQGGGQSEDLSKVMEPVADVMQEFGKFVKQRTSYTDYVLFGDIAPADDDRGPPAYGVHDIELKQDVDRSDFEEFVESEFVPAWKRPRDGMQLVITKGNRGDRKGKYQFVFVFDSVVTRDKFFPREGGGGSEAYKETMGPMTDVMNKLGEFMGESTSYTDYVSLLD